MTIEMWMAFVVTASIILMIPGPTILYVVMQSLANGRKSTIPLVAGVVAGDLTCITLSLVGLSALLATSATLFTLLKLVGAVYLIWLGINMLRTGWKSCELSKGSPNTSHKRLFAKVLAVAAMNPKGIIFYSAFMPQFANPSNSILPQLLLLALTFLLLAALNALFYSLLASKVFWFFDLPSRQRWFNYTGGVALVGAGAITASAKHL